MPYEFKLPDLGEGLTEGEIARWLVSEGQDVAEDDPLVEVQTDKTTVEIPSPRPGKVAKLMDLGAFVTILPGKDGLVHVSQISNERVEKVSDKLKEGDTVRVKVLEVDKQGRIRLSIKAVLEEEQQGAASA